MDVSNSIDRLEETISGILESGIQRITLPLVTTPVLLDSFVAEKQQIDSILKNVEIPADLQVKEAVEQQEEPIRTFNATLAQQTCDFVLRMGLTKTVDTIMYSVRNDSENTKEAIVFNGHELEKTELDAVNKCLLLLDLSMALANDLSFPSARSDFYQVLQLIVDLLTLLLDEVINVFWYGMESRQKVISTRIFDNTITLDRIAMLGVCNSITDKYYRRDDTGKYDSYHKDIFNNLLHARVRTFLANILQLDDLTGLNKHYTIANRENREPLLDSVKNGDDELLQDILEFRRLLRDPHKNRQALIQRAGSLERLLKYLLKEEEKYSVKHHRLDLYKVKPQYSDEHRARLTEKYNHTDFFPEHFWLSPFEETQSGEMFNEIKKEDQRQALKRFDLHKFRQLLLIQIFYVADFFVELLGARKRALLRLAGAPPSIKHISEETTSELVARTFRNIKAEIIRSSREYDTQLSFLLSHIAQSEENWWAWLIYGKNVHGNPILDKPIVSSKEIKETEDKFASFGKYKVQKYFNTHATPQLSRKMKIKTGLAHLEKSKQDVQTYDSRIEEINSKINDESNRETQASLKEQRSVLLWKKAKTMRHSNWLEVSRAVDPEMLGLEKFERRNEEEDDDDDNAMEVDEANKDSQVDSGNAEAKPDASREMEVLKDESKDENEGSQNDGSDKDGDVSKNPVEEKPSLIENGDISKNVLEEKSSLTLKGEITNNALEEESTLTDATSRKRARSPDNDENVAKKSKSS